MRYLRRDVLKAGVQIGTASAVLMAKAFAAVRLSVQAGQSIEDLGNLKRGSNMPLARIDIRRDASVELVRVVTEAVYRAMVDVANVPVHDKFQVISRHAADEIIYPQEGYLGLKYTRDLIIIQITWLSGRSTEVKKQFFHHIAEEIHTKGGVRKENVWINLIDTGREDWSFGNGEMQYGPD
jgi:4-oxalocrotonate tautomerase